MEVANIEETWRESYISVWRTAFIDEILNKEPRQPLLLWREDLPAECCAQIRGAYAPKIELSSAFALEMHSELQSVSAIISTYVPVRNRSFPGTCEESLMLTGELLRRFVLLHELFHLFCGHIDWLRERKIPAGVAFDELHLGLSHSKDTISGSKSADEISRAYMFEAEADGLAIQWLTRSTMFPQAGGFPGQTTASLSKLPKQTRITAFRLLLGAIWIVIRKIESNRVTNLAQHDGAHPLPGARAILAVAMLAREYTDVGEVEIDAHGGAHKRLTAREANRLQEFFPQVVRPVLGADWWPDLSHIPRKSLEGSLPTLLPALQKYILRQEPSDEFNLQIRRIEKMRLKLDRDLAKFRYLPLPSLSEGVVLEDDAF